MHPLITLEEHYIAPRVHAASKEVRDHFAPFPAQTMAKLQELGEGRVKDMDNGNVSIQVISHGPGDLSPQLCAEANDDLAAAIAKNPTRLAGFAMLPMSQPDDAAVELERTVKKLGFVGALVENHLNGTFYDAERFWVVFEKAQELDVPIYIHPTFASDSMLEYHKGNYSDSIATALSAYGWGWHSETALHILRLYASGLFERFPNLKIVIGHMGELLPFQLDRVFNVTDRWAKKVPFKHVWHNNIWVTTSGMFSLTPLDCLLKTTSIDRIMYSVDYPFSANEKGMQFFEEIEKSGLIADDDLAKFAYLNAEKLLKVKTKAFTN